ncbi:MAG: hypothetical protein BRC26_02420, partial [Nanohaloarchaea archaeon QH_8_44_6]
TSWSYDTKEESHWEWASEDDEDDPDLLEIACKTYARSQKTEGESLSQREVSEIFEISRSRISENYEKYM